MHDVSTEKELSSIPEILFEVETDASNPVEELINGLMHPNPDQRLTLAMAMQSPVFDEIFDKGGRETVKQSVKDLIAQELPV